LQASARRPRDGSIVSAREIVAVASPLLPGGLLALTLFARVRVDVLAPMQFFLLAAEAALAASTHRTIALGLASLGFVLAFAGLLAVVLHDRWLAFRSARRIDWTRFESELDAYVHKRQERGRQRREGGD
jgi:hypothetical protein